MPKRNLIWLATAAVVGLMLWIVPARLLRQEKFYEQFRPLLDVNLEIQKNYVEPVPQETLVRGAIDGMLNRLDPYSQYFDEEQYEQFQKTTEGRYNGIGIEIEQGENGELIVVSPLDDSPAFTAGLRSGDRITHIDGKKTFELTLLQCVQMITGRPGTSVTLRIHRPATNETLEQAVTRGLITNRTVRGWARDENWEWDYLLDPPTGIGYVRLSSFERATTEQLDEAIRRLLAGEHLRALILDVRDNPGGLLAAVVEVANRFLTQGTIVSIKYRTQPERPYLANSVHNYPNIPLVVLVNKGSASAAEILAGALRDHRRATLIGVTTFGKGSVQELIELQGQNRIKGAVKLTTAYYYLPNGERIHGKGVKPDQAVELTPQEQGAMQESWRAVYSTRQPPGTQPATASAPAPRQARIIIDRQLQAALDLLKRKLPR